VSIPDAYILTGAALLSLLLLILVRRLIQSEAQFRMLAANSGDVVCLHGPNRECLYVSPSVTRVLGIPEPVCPAQYVHAEDKPYVDRMFQSALYSKEPVVCTFRAYTATGDLIWLESLLRPLPDGKVVTTSRDVTNRKQVEDLYRILAESLPKNSFVLYDRGLRVLLAAGPLVRMNETSLGGKGDGQHLLEVFRSLFDPEQLAAEDRYWTEALEGRSSTVEIPLRGAVYQLQHVPVMEGEEVIAGLMVATDVTEDRAREAVLKDRTDDLERSNRDLEQFADIASHELKTPLRHISSFAEILAEEHEGLLSEEADGCIGNITQGVREMQGVIEALLRYSRAKTNESRMQSVNLNGLLEQVLRSLAPRIEAAGGVVEAKLGSFPTVRGDPVLIKQLLENMLGNAIKFSQPNPVVHVTAARDLLDWVISVEDNGPGVSAEHREYIFQMFKRSRTDVEGSGIGLALCKKIAGIHRGKIWVEDGSGPPERPGALFRVSFPARIRDDITQH